MRTNARAQLEAIRDEWLAPLVDRIGNLERENGRLEAERDELRRRAEAAEAEQDALRSQTAPQPPGEAPKSRVGRCPGRAEARWWLLGAGAARVRWGVKGVPMPSSSDDLATLVYRFIADHGPLTASDMAVALGRDGRQVSKAMARLLDAQRLVVAGVTPDGQPLYAVAVAQAETDDQEGREG